MLTEIVLALVYNRIDKRLPANETKHSQTRKEIETKHSQTTLKPYLIQHILAKTCTQNAFFLFKKKKKNSSPKKNVRLEKNIPEKKKNRALTTEKREKIETEYSQIETVWLGYLFIYFGWQPVEVEQWWRSNGGGDREKETQVQNVERETHTHTNGETNGLNTKRRERVRCFLLLGLEIGLECNKLR